jgi:hypothetical protein
MIMNINININININMNINMDMDMCTYADRLQQFFNTGMLDCPVPSQSNVGIEKY